MLKRAAELHGEQGPTDTSGLTLAELEHIAAEVGIEMAVGPVTRGRQARNSRPVIVQGDHKDRPYLCR